MKMKHLKTILLALSLLLTGSYAVKADPITDISQLSNAKAYTITTARGAWTLNTAGTTICSTKTDNGSNDYADADQSTRSLKAVGEWKGSDADDALGFGALPSGIYDNGSFSDLTISANYWTSGFFDNAPGGVGVTISYYTSKITFTSFSANIYASVRCVKDVGSTTWLNY